MLNVLVTGAGGFIGSHLVDSQLEQGAMVKAVDLHPGALKHALDHPNLTFIQGDIQDQEQAEAWMGGIDIVYHLASAHLDVSLSDQHYRKVNVGGTLTLLAAACRAGVKRFVHCSSVGVMGDIEHPPADETYPCHPTNIYEQTKLEGEQAARSFGKENNFPVVIARPAWVYGTRCPRTEKLFRQVYKRRFPIFGKGQNLRHPIYISDAVKGFELCAEVDEAVGETFIIAGDQPVIINDLLTEIAWAQNVPAPTLRFPMPLGILAGYAIQAGFKLIGRRPPFSRRSLDFFLKHNAYDISKARRVLHFQPAVDLRAGLERTILSSKKP
jgi:nucleoside-diphosphate-sugar epimerase